MPIWKSRGDFNPPIDCIIDTGRGLFFSIDEFDADDDFGDQLSTLQKPKIFASFWE
jgi:hypothetical protein